MVFVSAFEVRSFILRDASVSREPESSERDSIDGAEVLVRAKAEPGVAAGDNLDLPCLDVRQTNQFADAPRLALMWRYSATRPLCDG